MADVLPMSPREPADLARVLARLEAVLTRMEAMLPRVVGVASAPPPKAYLGSWREILKAVDEPNTRAGREKVRRMNDFFKGPILMPRRRGGQPHACRQTLLEWWDRVDLQIADLRQRQLSAALTVSDRHNYARDDVLAPEIAGSIRKRRSA